MNEPPKDSFSVARPPGCERLVDDLTKIITDEDSRAALAGGRRPAQRIRQLSLGTRKTINIGDVAADVRYLSAFSSTQWQIIVPVFGKVAR
ncbi:MAG: hypothetical protein JO356_17225 [Acidobacteria bacterium]|nr:hypothetical protein [Acidobacteriota bacterium]